MTDDPISTTTHTRKPLVSETDRRWWLRLRLLLLLGAFAVGFWSRGWFVAPEPAPPQVVFAAERPEPAEGILVEVDVLRRQVAEQRALLRPQALATKQTLDEIMALVPSLYPAGDWTLPEAGALEDCWFETTDGIRLHGWYAAKPGARAAIVLMHGNAGNVALWGDYALQVSRRANASTILFDYRGYGRSEGRPTFDGMIRDGQAARDYLALRENRPATEIVLLGRSMGGAIAVQVAARDGARALILERTFASLQEVAGTHFPKALVNVLVANRLQSGVELPKFKGPVLISHGETDEVIPFAQGQALFNTANQPKRFVALGPIGHNDEQPELYWLALNRFLDELAK
jgi:fermentation-respiration switch protein FrsA (DUF1100 family)